MERLHQNGIGGILDYAAGGCVNERMHYCPFCFSASASVGQARDRRALGVAGGYFALRQLVSSGAGDGGATDLCSGADARSGQTIAYRMQGRDTMLDSHFGPCPLKQTFAPLARPVWV